MKDVSKLSDAVLVRAFERSVARAAPAAAGLVISPMAAVDAEAVGAYRVELLRRLDGTAEGVLPRGSYCMEVGKEVAERAREGKPEWPHHLVLWVERRMALHWIQRLCATSLSHQEPMLSLAVMGELRRDEDDEGVIRVCAACGGDGWAYGDDVTASKQDKCGRCDGTGRLGVES